MAAKRGGRRPGTEAVAQVVGLGKACELAALELDEFATRMAELKQRLWARLSAELPNLHRTVPPDICVLPNTLHLCVPGLNGRDILAAAPQIAASTGSACHAGADAVPGVLGEMGLPAQLARGALRLSLGHTTSVVNVDAATTALVAAIRALVKARGA